MGRLLATLVIIFASAVVAVGQSFQPVAQVNDDVVTAWELQQRQRMLAILNAPPEVVADSLDSLIDERVQLQTAETFEVEVSEEAIASGIEDFAARGNLSAEQFLTLIGNEGVDPTTIRDFIRAGLAWRSTVRARFGGEVRISEDDVARAQDEVRAEGGPEVLLSEILLPARNELERAESQALAEEISRAGSVAEFSSAARQYSIADSAADGGQVGWIPLEELQGPVATAIQGLQDGRVTDPIQLPDQIALFQLRGQREGQVAAGDVVIDYVQLLIPGGLTELALTEASRINRSTDTCDDLYDVAGAGLVREQRPASQIPADVRAQLAGLDRYEVSTALTRGGNLVFLMLCDRGASGQLAIEDTATSARLNNERLAGLAAIWLAELKSQAYIRIGGE